MSFDERNTFATDPRMAKFTFCAMSPVAFASATVSSFETTTPTTPPKRSIAGPPLLPGCTGAEIWMLVSSPCSPFRDEMLPRLTFNPPSKP